jgi:tetratricopeptide (TPR) repeat protein
MADGIGDGALPLPHGIRETVRRRLAGLPDEVRELCGLAAVLDASFDSAMACHILGWSADACTAALEQLLARRLLRESRTDRGRFEFTNSLVRRIVQDEVPAEVRRSFHRSAAGRLAAVAETDPDARSSLRFHLERGGVKPERGRRRGWKMPSAAAAACVLVAAIALWVGRDTAPTPPPLMAIGWFDDLRGAGDANLSDALVDMLATNLARVPGLQVVSSARMYELLGQLDSVGGRRAALAGAARQAGAGSLLEGSLLALAEGRLRLDLRRVDVRSGAVQHAATVEADDVFELVDRATHAVANGMELRTPPLRLADATTSSLVAYRFYEEGLRHFAGADYRSALHLFDAALLEDSEFVLADYYAWRTRSALALPTPASALARMRQLADHAPERDRLLIHGHLGLARNDPLFSNVAETLAIRYPSEPEGQYLVGISRFLEGDFPGALGALERVVAMDSLGLRGSRARCLACDALAEIVSVYVHMDSLGRAKVVAREWLDVQPTSARAWALFAASLLFSGQVDSAVVARRRASQLNPIDAYDAVFPAIASIHGGEFGTADRIFRDLARTGIPDVQGEALWFLAISLRTQGRLTEALATQRMLSVMRVPAEPNTFEANRRHEAQILFELQRYAEAADLLRQPLAGSTLNAAAFTEGHAARQQSINYTQLASILAATGDTVTLARIADSVEVWGARSAYGRDRRLHHHVRGLLLAERGEYQRSADEFRQALYSTTSGYTRSNLELARILLRLGEAQEAIAVLEPALRGPLESSNVFVTRTELYDLLGRALQAAGRPDSAGAVYRRVVTSWRAADSLLVSRRGSTEQNLRALALKH